MEGAPEIEKRLTLLMENPASSIYEIMESIRSLPSGERFFFGEKWMELSLNGALETWRRIESYRIFLKHCITFPCDFAYFFMAAIAPFGVEQGQLVNMSKAQHVPFERKGGELIYMANLPIWTASGPASVYFVLVRPTNRVERAAISPECVDPES